MLPDQPLGGGAAADTLATSVTTSDACFVTACTCGPIFFFAASAIAAIALAADEAVGLASPRKSSTPTSSSRRTAVASEQRIHNFFSGPLIQRLFAKLDSVESEMSGCVSTALAMTAASPL